MIPTLKGSVMTPRQLEGGEIDWHAEALHWQGEAMRSRDEAMKARNEALRELRTDILAHVEDKHRRLTDRVEKCESAQKETQALCRQEVKDFRSEQMTFFVSKAELKTMLDLIYERVRLPTALIYSLCGILLTAVIYAIIHAKGIIG